jgi:hypothetical protein
MQDNGDTNLHRKNHKAIFPGTLGLAVIVLVILGIRYLLRSPSTGWRSVSGGTAETQGDIRGNVAVILEGQNFVAIVATNFPLGKHEVEFSGGLAAVTADDSDYSIRPVLVLTNSNQLSIVLPDGRSGHFHLPPGFAQKYHKDPTCGTGSLLQGALAHCDDQALRADVQKLLSGYREPAWSDRPTPRSPPH